MRHGCARHHAWRSFPKPSQCLGHTSRFIQQLVALQHQFFVPAVRVRAEREPHPSAPPLACSAVFGRLYPLLKPWQDLRSYKLRRPLPPVFPGKITVPVLPVGSFARARRFFSCEAEMADRVDTLSGRMGMVTIRKGVELLHVAQRVVGLALHPCAQTRLQGSMRKFEGARS